MKTGYVKFDRKIKDWGWYTDLATFKLFFHLITFANYADGEYLGIPIKRGQIAKSYAQLSKETGLSTRSLRTAINHLISTEEVTQTKYPKFSVFTVKNYCRYQSGDTVSDTAATGDRQATDTQSKKKNNNNNKKKILSLRESTKEKPPDLAADFSTSPPREEQRAYGKHKNVYLTDVEYSDVKSKCPAYLDIFSDKLKKKGYSFDNHYEIIMQWASEKGYIKEPRCSGFETDEFFSRAVEKTKRRREKAIC